MFPFEKVVGISLQRAQERWHRFQSKLPSDWPFRPPEKFLAIDGRRVPAAPWWTAGKSAWGCYQSHLQILKDCLANNINSVLVLEDDAVCVPDFASSAKRFFEELPDDWQLLYLGGQHLQRWQHPPIHVTESVQIPYNVNRTHAYAVRSRHAIERLCRHLQDHANCQSGHHIDHHLGTLVQQRRFPVYCPSRWLIGQDDGHSSISGRHLDRRFFDASPVSKLFYTDFVMVTGADPALANSKALQLKKQGVFMGKTFVQADAPNAENPYRQIDTGQSVELQTILQKYAAQPDGSTTAWVGGLRCELAEWLRYMTFTARSLNTVAGGYAPQFTHLVPLMKSLLGQQLKVIESRTNESAHA